MKQVLLMHLLWLQVVSSPVLSAQAPVQTQVHQLTVKSKPAVQPPKAQTPVPKRSARNKRVNT